jgi:hypothetical protein
MSGSELRREELHMLVLLIAGSIGLVIVIEVIVGRAEGRKTIVRYSEPQAAVADETGDHQRGPEKPV